MVVRNAKWQHLGLAPVIFLLAVNEPLLLGDSVTIHQDGITFAIPENLIDITPYDFRDNQRRESLMVGYGTLPRGVTTVEALMADRRKEYEFKSGTKIKPIIVSNGLILGLKARRLQFTIDSELEVAGCWVVAILDNSNYIQISYGGREGDTSVERSSHIFSSIRRAGNWPQASAGYKRRHAGTITLEVPERLNPPHTFQLVSFGEKIGVEIRLPNPDSTPTTLDMAVLVDASVGVVHNQQTKLLEGIDGQGSTISYYLTRSEPNTEAQFVRRSQLTVAGKTIQISGKAPLADAPELEAMLARVIASLQVEK